MISHKNFDFNKLTLFFEKTKPENSAENLQVRYYVGVFFMFLG